MKIMIVCIMLFLAGCGSTINSNVMPDANISSYKRAYIQPAQEDDFNLTGYISAELAQMGYQVFNKTPESPTSSDMLVKFNYHGWWDFGKYLESFNIQFLNASTKASIGNINFNCRGNFGYDTRERVADAFSDFKTQLTKRQHLHP